jgi:sugar phosphate isomerase/epimerase
MDLGLLTSCLPEVSFPELARWAAQTGFRTLEAACVPRGALWYDGSRLVPAKINEAAAAEIEELLASTGLHLSALTYCDNMLEPDEAGRAAKWRMLAETVQAAARLKVPVVSCFVGRDPAQRVGEGIAAWARLAADVIRKAEELNIRLAIENCPMPGWQFEDLPGNLAFSPELWEKIFTHARSDCVGLNFDPSHLVWLGVDYLDAVTAYAERIYHVHAKDTEVFKDRLSDCSVLRPAGGWWRYRLPGLGDIDWRRLINRLQEHGYDGALSIEHEDPVWSGSQEKIKRGLEFGRRHLEQFLV